MTLLALALIKDNCVGRFSIKYETKGEQILSTIVKDRKLVCIFILASGVVESLSRNASNYSMGDLVRYGNTCETYWVANLIMRQCLEHSVMGVYSYLRTNFLG